MYVHPERIGDPEYDALFVRVESIRSELWNLKMARGIFNPAVMHSVDQPETPMGKTIREGLEGELAAREERLKRRLEESEWKARIDAELLKLPKGDPSKAN